MLLTVARIENGLVFNGGEAFSLLEPEQRSLENGWYVCKVTQSSIVDKKGVTRPYFYAVKKMSEDDVLLGDILNIYYITNRGIKLIFNKYADLLPETMKSDGRFRSLQSLVSIVSDYSMATINDNEMKSYVHKLSCIVMKKLLTDYVKDVIFVGNNSV